MHLHSRPNFEADARAFVAARYLRKVIPAALSAGASPDSTIEGVLAGFSVESIHGYCVYIEDALLRRLKPLMASDYAEVRAEACFALIDLASILASTSSLERCFSARDAFVRTMTTLEMPIAFDIAS